MKKLLSPFVLLASLLLLFIPVSTRVSSMHDTKFNNFNIDELEMTLNQTDLDGHELVKPPSPLIVWFRRIMSPLAVVVIKICDAIRNRWFSAFSKSA